MTTPRRTVRTIWLTILVALLALPALAQSPQNSRNDRYVDPDLDIERMVDALERQGREVYELREEIVAASGILPGDVVADVGAGTGAFLDPLVDAVGPTGHLFSVEISIRFVERLRQLADEAGYDNVTVVFSSPTSATLPPGSVDRIFLVDTYHHFDDYRAMLASMRAALRSGGEMIVVDFDRVEGQSRSWILDHVRASADTFRQEIEEAGFEFVGAVEIDGMVDNFFHRYRRP